MGEFRAFILDGYVDEPACFGVPPYISPYVRCCAGVLALRGATAACATCDEWRGDRATHDAQIAEADVVVVIMGLTVPGRYRGGSPLTMRELAEIGAMRRRGVLIVGGPVRSGYVLRGGGHATTAMPDGVDMVATGDIEASLDRYMATGELCPTLRRGYDLVRAASIAGAYTVSTRAGAPHVIAEIELSRGCERTDGRCSFCTEGIGGAYEERSAEDTAAEIEALYRAGCRAFRLGRCANILAWGARRTSEGAVPDARRIRELYAAIRSAAPGLSVLHTDNCSPLSVARWPDESAEAIAAIAELGTEGDGLSMGLESLDPVVREMNGLKVSADDALRAVRIVNEAGGFRRGGGMPAILPGLNFLSGLAGETKASFDHGRAFLRRLIDEGLAVRRINIRRAMIFDGAPLARLDADRRTASRARAHEHRRWRDWVREEIDPVMLERVAPDGTIIRGIVLEERAGGVIFGRPLGSYPPLVGVVDPTLAPGQVIDAAVVGRGARSLTAVPYPLDANAATRAQFEALPGIGRARAQALIDGRPYASSAELQKKLDAMDAPSLSCRLGAYFAEI